MKTQKLPAFTLKVARWSQPVTPSKKSIKSNLGPLSLQRFLGITMGVLILMAMAAAPSAHATSLLTYYDFEDFNFISDPPGLQTTQITPPPPTFSSGGGTNVNAVTPSTISALIFQNPTSFTLGGLTTTGLTDVNLSFALGATGLPFTTLDLLYNTNGGVGAYTTFATGISPIGPYTARNFDVSALTGGAVNNVSGSNLFFEFSFNGGTNGGVILMDNIQVTAGSSSVPDTGATIFLAGLGLVPIAVLRRKLA
jgi:VPDSG-CTERM motif